MYMYMCTCSYARIAHMQCGQILKLKNPLYNRLVETWALKSFSLSFVDRDTDFLGEGLDQLVCLTENYHYLPSLHVLRYITPLFVDKPQALIQNDK